MKKYISAHRRNFIKPDLNGNQWGYGSIASFNRHTNKPHENLREIGRRMSMPGTELRREYMKDARNGH